MKVYINRKPVAGPWGGGSKILTACIDALKRAQHDVTFTLTKDVDVVFCFDPRQGPEADQMGYVGILSFVRDLVKVGKIIPIVQRVGDLGTHGKPDLFKLVLASTNVSTIVIYPSVWAYDYVRNAASLYNIRHTNHWSVIRNAPVDVFKKYRAIKNDIPKNISFVTHHWSTNPLKGFSFYEQFNNWCLKNGHTFTFIGRKPDNVKLNVIGPLNEHELAVELPKYDVYVTASEAEAGANHVLEAIASGLPVIFSVKGGSIPEYCAGMGIQFDGTLDDISRAVHYLRLDFKKIKKRLIAYDETIDDVAQRYVQVIEGVQRKNA